VPYASHFARPCHEGFNTGGGECILLKVKHRNAIAEKFPFIFKFRKEKKIYEYPKKCYGRKSPPLFFILMKIPRAEIANFGI